MAETKQKQLPEDRTELADLWAEAVADLDEAKETLASAQEREAEVWAALKQSRSQSVPSDEY